MLDKAISKTVYKEEERREDKFISPNNIKPVKNINKNP